MAVPGFLGHQSFRARTRRHVSVIFETERLSFRHLLPTDLDALYVLYRDPEIREHFPDFTRTREETKEELEWFLQGHPEHPELGLWAAIHRESGAFLGRCGLLPWMIDGRLEVEIAYMIDKAHWRQGLGAEAARGLVKHGFETLGLRRLIALIAPEHEASIRTARSAGLSLERETTMDGLPTAIYAIER